MVTSIEVPIANAGPDTSFCIGTGTLGALPPNVGSGVWNVLTAGGSVANSNLDSTAITALNVGPNLFEWEVTNSICAASDTVVVTGVQVPIANAGFDGSTCDSNYVLTGLPPSSGSGAWSTLQVGATFGNSTLATSAVTFQDTGAFQLVWLVTNSICSAADTVTISSYSSPFVFAGNDTTVCTNQTQLEATFSSSSTGTWTVLSGISTIVSPNSFSTQVNNLAIGNNLFEWNQSSGSCQGTDTVLVNFLPLAFANAGPDQDFCGLTTTMAAILPNGHTGIFQDLNGLAVFGNPTLPNTAVTLPDSGAYSLLWIIDNGSCQDTATVTLQSDMPIVANAGVDQNICFDTLTLNATLSPLGSGIWSQPAAGTAVFSNPSAGNTLVSQLASGSNILIWTGTNGSCTSIDTVVASRPSFVASAGQDLDLCEFDTISLSANNPSPYNGSWQIVAGPIGMSSLTNENALVTATDVGSMVLVWEIDHIGCTTRDTMNIEVYESPIANAGLDQTLTSVTTANLQGNSLPSPFVTQWSTSSVGNILNPTSASTEVTGLVSGQHAFVWTVQNGPCAPAIDTVLISITNELKIPNAISPNQDGKNETFFIQGLESLGTVSLEIFNRWGGMIFESTDYQNDWAGRNMNGAQMPDDTYYYVLKASDGFEQAGFIIVKTKH